MRPPGPTTSIAAGSTCTKATRQLLLTQLSLCATHIYIRVTEVLQLETLRIKLKPGLYMARIGELAAQPKPHILSNGVAPALEGFWHIALG